MSEKMNTYEGMFLVDAGNPDFHAASEPARAALDRNEAQVLSLKPWDERRLAYEVRGRKRGLYILAYFQAAPERIAEIERHCQLDERILRLLILRREGLTDEVLGAETPATSSARRAAARRAEDAPVSARTAGAEEPEAAPQGEDRADQPGDEESPGDPEDLGGADDAQGDDEDGKS